MLTFDDWCVIFEKLEPHDQISFSSVCNQFHKIFVKLSGIQKYRSLLIVIQQDWINMIDLFSLSAVSSDLYQMIKWALKTFPNLIKRTKILEKLNNLQKKGLIVVKSSIYHKLLRQSTFVCEQKNFADRLSFLLRSFNGKTCVDIKDELGRYFKFPPIYSRHPLSFQVQKIKSFHYQIIIDTTYENFYYELSLDETHLRLGCILTKIIPSLLKFFPPSHIAIMILTFAACKILSKTNSFETLYKCGPNA